MGFGYKRGDLRAIAQAKLDDAIFLVRHRRFSNAYYLAGYAVEIGLKACIAAQMSAETIPDKAFVKKIFEHDLKGLVGLAGLQTELKDRENADSTFAANWAIAAEWKPDARYESTDPMSAQMLVDAIAHQKSGVFEWIKMHW